MTIAISGLGFVGSSIIKSFNIKNIPTIGYDKYKPSPNTLNDCLYSQIIFLCLPTLFDDKSKEYDKSALLENLNFLQTNNYTGLVIIKSTLEPGTCESFAMQYPLLKIIHNPEFLTARTAFNDFHNQKNIILGYTKNSSPEDVSIIYEFYKTHYQQAKITITNSNESETIKICCNSFYAIKIQFFNEIFDLCKKLGNCNYNAVKQGMIDNNWINPMHTCVPGYDGKLSYGGLCFVKDTKALNEFCKKNSIHHKVLESTIQERDLLRDD